MRAYSLLRILLCFLVSLDPFSSSGLDFDSPRILIVIVIVIVITIIMMVIIVIVVIIITIIIIIVVVAAALLGQLAEFAQAAG